MNRQRGSAPVILAYAAFVLVGVGAGVSGVLLPAQISDYGVDETVIGLTFFAFSTGFLLGGATTGAVLHRLGIRAALVMAAALYTVAACGTAIRPGFWAFVALQVIVGYGTGLLESALNVDLSTRPSATTLINRLHAFFGVGALAGPLLAAWMLTTRPWTAVWAVLGAAGLALAVGFMLVHPPAPARTAGTDGTPRHTGTLAEAVRSPAVLLGSMFLAAYVGLEIGVGNWGYTFLVTVHDQPALLAGYAVSGYWLGLTLGRFLISPLAARIGISSATMITACLLGVAASTLLAWVAPAGIQAAAALALLGFFLGPVFPTAVAVVPQLVDPRLAPTVIGVLNGVSVLGGAVFPWLAGALAQGVGVWTLMPLALVLAALQLGAWRRLLPQATRALLR